MTENAQRAEKQIDKEAAGESSAQQSREAFSQEAMSQSIKNAQTARAAGDAGSIAAGAAAMMQRKNEMLPNVSLHEAAHGIQAQEGKAYQKEYNTPGKMGSAAFDKANQANSDKMDSGNSDKIHSAISDLIKNSKVNDSKEDLYGSLKQIFTDKDGVTKLATGDYLVKEDGRQSLFTPNGDRVTINPDGTHVIKGDVRKVTSGKDGTTTVEFADGATVSFDKIGFTEVTRGKETVRLDWDRKLIDRYPFPKPEPYPFPHPEPYPSPKPEPRPYPSWPIDRIEPKPMPDPGFPERIHPEDIEKYLQKADKTRE